MGGSLELSGRLLAGHDMLLLETAGGQQYKVTYSGFESLRDPGFRMSALGPRLTMTNGTTLWDSEQARRYVRLREAGEHPITAGDFHAVDVGFYLGVGGHISVKWDRFGRTYVGLNVGLGLGGPAFSLTRGSLPRDYAPDQGQLDQAIGGWGFALQGGYGTVGAVNVADEGPLPVQYGVGTPGIAAAGGYSWRVR